MLLNRLLVPLLLPAGPILRSASILCVPAEDAAEDIHNLLLQRAVQASCFTARNLRDPPTARWLAKFGGQPDGFESAHAFGGMRLSWRAYLLAMLSAPNEEIVVESVLQKHRGVSANNPFLQPSKMTYTYELRPSEVVERVMLAARQIAREWSEEDLPRMAAQNQEVVHPSTLLAMLMMPDWVHRSSHIGHQPALCCLLHATSCTLPLVHRPLLADMGRASGERDA